MVRHIQLQLHCQLVLAQVHHCHRTALVCCIRHTFDATHAHLQNEPFCYLDNRQMQDIGLENLGYESWDALWQDYTVFTMVRNPYDRAGSSYDYLLKRRKVRSRCQRARTWAEVRRLSSL